MSRLKADLLLLLAALIWGTAFIAQKGAMAHIGPFTFVAARFALSALLVLPLALRERRRGRVSSAQAGRVNLFLLCLFFSAATLVQQFGIPRTSVANAGFFTGLYVLFVPVICRIGYGQRLPALIFPAVVVSAFGVWLMSGGALDSFAHLSAGDILCLLCAVTYAPQIALMGRLAEATHAPFQLSVLQYAVLALSALAGALLWEHPALSGLVAALPSILYAGVLSGGIAYTAQAVAQQHTPASDSSILMSAEAVFAALAGLLAMGETMTLQAVIGGALILAAILAVELHAYARIKK